MDEVDGIIIVSLKSIGCSLEEDVSSLSSFTADMIYAAVYSCIAAIRGADKVDAPSKLPPGMSQRFKAGSNLASLVTTLGFNGEVGYQTFLYSNEVEVRKVLMYLIDQLPRDTGTSEQTSTATKSLRVSIKSVLSSSLKQVWLPPVCRGKVDSQSFIAPRLIYATKPGDEDRCPPLSQQTANCRSLCTALIENNALQLCSDQLFEWKLATPKQKKLKEKMESLKTELIEERKVVMEAERDSLIQSLADESAQLLSNMSLQTSGTGAEASSEPVSSKLPAAPESQAISEEETLKQCEEEVSGLKGQLDEVVKRLDKLNSRITKAETATQQEETQVAEKTKQTEERKKTYQVQKKTLNVLPEAQQNIEKLNQLISGADGKMAILKSQWEQHKSPLLEKRDMLKAQASSRQETIHKMLSEVTDFRQQVKSASTEVKTKDDLIKQLTEEYNSMGKDSSRSSYTKRILEIVSNIKKQKADINKVLDDTRVVQKDINNMTGTLERSFTVTDELIFRDAKKDESVRAAYKYLASLHDNCQSVRSAVEESGVILREIRELDDQIEQEANKDTASTLKKILSDYNEIKKENQALIAKLKAAQ